MKILILQILGLPLFPPLPIDTDEKVVEEIRRTIVVMGLSQSASSQEVMEAFATGAGEVKYFRQDVKYLLQIYFPSTFLC